MYFPCSIFKSFRFTSQRNNQLTKEGCSILSRILEKVENDDGKASSLLQASKYLSVNLTLLVSKSVGFSDT